MQYPWVTSHWRAPPGRSWAGAEGCTPGPGGTFYDPGHQLSPPMPAMTTVSASLGLHRRQTVTAAEDNSGPPPYRAGRSPGPPLEGLPRPWPPPLKCAPPAGAKQADRHGRSPTSASRALGGTCSAMAARRGDSSNRLIPFSLPQKTGAEPAPVFGFTPVCHDDRVELFHQLFHGLVVDQAGLLHSLRSGRRGSPGSAYRCQ